MLRSASGPIARSISSPWVPGPTVRNRAGSVRIRRPSTGSLTSVPNRPSRTTAREPAARRPANARGETASHSRASYHPARRAPGRRAPENASPARRYGSARRPATLADIDRRTPAVVAQVPGDDAPQPVPAVATRAGRHDGLAIRRDPVGEPADPVHED